MKIKLLNDYLWSNSGIYFTQYHRDDKESLAFIVVLLGYGFIVYREP